jgi:hypothetical protein
MAYIVIKPMISNLIPVIPLIYVPDDIFEDLERSMKD